MNYLKRSFYSLRHNWLRTLLTVLMFTVLFAACVGSLVLYQTSKSQLQFMQETVKYSVTLKPALIWDKSVSGMTGNDMDPDIIDFFANSPHLSGYNYSSTYLGELEGAKRLYPEEKIENEKQVGNTEIWLYCPLESATDRAFTIGGYRLAEGRHFTRDEVHVCLVSKEFADYNGFTIGDHFAFVDTLYKRNEEPQDLEIVGIFKGPVSEIAKGTGRTPEETLFTPLAFREEAYTDESNPAFLQAFCKSQEDMEAFAEELKGRYNITQVVDNPMNVPSYIPPPEEFGPVDFDELAELLRETPMYILEYEHQMYDMTAVPMEKMNILAKVMTMAFLAAAALVLILSNTIFLKSKRREFGMLCAMGESKVKIVLQAAVEILVPILLAMLLGLAAGVSVGVPLAESLGGDIYTQNAADIQGQNDLISYAHRGQDTYSRGRVYTATAAILANGMTHDVVTPPKPQAVVDADTLTGYFSIVLVLAWLALVIQAGSVLRMRPAKILMRKG